MRNLNEYRKAARKYRPDKIRVLFVAESPPAFDEEKGKSYFFFEENPGGEILFATFVKAIYDIDYRKRGGNKAELLRRLQKDHFWLIDAVEYPINRKDGRVVSQTGRAFEIGANMPSLLRRLGNLRRNGIIHRRTGIILIKKIIYETLAGPLAEAGYKVLNTAKIDFPKYYRDRDTVREIRKALKGM